MTSKEALKNIKTLSYCKQHITIQEWCNIIEQDLDRLEKLEEENASLHTEIESLHTEIKSVSSETEEQFKKFLDKENQKLKLSRESIKNNYVELVDKLVKENKNLKEEMGMYIDTNNKFYDEIEKLKKVIELLEPKSINTLQLRYSKNVEEYNEWASKYYQLTQEEYELLKEYFR